MLQRMAVLHRALYLRINREAPVDCMKYTGDRLGRREKAKWENLWDWKKSTMIDTCYFYTGGYRIVISQQLK